MRDPREVIIRPVVTEASAMLQEERQTYTFIVAKDSNKIEIRNAVQSLFGVTVRTCARRTTRARCAASAAASAASRATRRPWSSWSRVTRSTYTRGSDADEEIQADDAGHAVPLGHGIR
jgi:ribosomal protein L23